MAAPIDTYGDSYGDIYGAPRWNNRPAETDKSKRHEDYRDFLEGREIISTIRSAFDAMATLLLQS